MIRELLALVLVASLGFAAECGQWNENDSCILWNDPPILNVTLHNTAIAQDLMDNDALITEEFGVEKSVLVDMRVLGALPMVDNRMPSNASGILWTWAVENASKITIEKECGCKDVYYPVVVRYYRNTSAYFTFRNETREVALQEDSWANASGDWGEVEMEYEIMPIPFSEEELEVANGTENISVEIRWSYYYISEVHASKETAKYTNGSCNGCETEQTDEEPWHETPSGSHAMAFIVESGEPEFFMVRPVLGEQWYLSNHFDNFIFSRKSIYKAEIAKDGEGAAEARIRNFTIISFNVPGLEGVWYIISHNASDFENSGMGAYEVEYWATPLANSSLPFSHLYEVNHTYGEWGPHGMEIAAYDYFGGRHVYSEEILSRKATRGGVSETGEEGDDELYYRPGLENEDYGKLSRFVIPSSTLLVVFLVFALWAYAYYRRERGKRR
jgi:hypothetical protein